MNKALFIDRDGIINVEKNYVYKVEDFEFMEDIFETLKCFQDSGFLLVIITNQAGIGRGYYSEQDFLHLTAWMLEQFRLKEVVISKVYYSPYHPTHGVGHYKKDSFCRKPNPGMILKARDEFVISLPESILIGDKESDIQAGLNAGVGVNVLLRSSERKEKSAAQFTIDKIKELINLTF